MLSNILMFRSPVRNCKNSPDLVVSYVSSYRLTHRCRTVVFTVSYMPQQFDFKCQWSTCQYVNADVSKLKTPESLPFNQGASSCSVVVLDARVGVMVVVADPGYKKTQKCWLFLDS